MASINDNRLEAPTAIPKDGIEPNRSDRNATASTQPIEQLEVNENVPSEEVVYPTGAKVWLALGAMYTAFFLTGLVGIQNVGLKLTNVARTSLSLLLLCPASPIISKP